MGQFAPIVFFPPTTTSFPPLIIQARGVAGIASLEVDNGSALTLTVKGDGAVIRVVAPYTARFCLNTGGQWQTIEISANSAAIASTDSVVIVAYDQAVVPPLLPSYGPSAWGGGASASTLRSVKQGDQFLAWQVQQFMDLLTGVMTGQLVSLADGLDVSGFPGTGTGSSVEIGTFGSPVTGVVQAFDRVNNVALKLELGVSGAITIATSGRVSVANTGASGKALLNTIPSTGNFPATTFTPPSGSFAMQTITGLPASATEATISIVMPGLGTQLLEVATDTSVNTNTCAELLDSATASQHLQVRVPIATASQIAFSWLAGTARAITVYLIDYNEPS